MTPHFPLPSAPSNHPSTFCFYNFDYSRSLPTHCNLSSPTEIPAAAVLLVLLTLISPPPKSTFHIASWVIFLKHRFDSITPLSRKPDGSPLLSRRSPEPLSVSGLCPTLAALGPCHPHTYFTLKSSSSWTTFHTPKAGFFSRWLVMPVPLLEGSNHTHTYLTCPPDKPLPSRLSSIVTPFEKLSLLPFESMEKLWQLSSLLSTAIAQILWCYSTFPTSPPKLWAPRG